MATLCNDQNQTGGADRLDYMMTKLEGAGGAAIFGWEQEFVLKNKNWWQKIEKQCEWIHVLQLDHTMILFFYSCLCILLKWLYTTFTFFFLFFLLVFLVKTLIVFSFCQRIAFYIKKTLLSTNKLGTRYFMAVFALGLFKVTCSLAKKEKADLRFSRRCI